MKKPISLRQSLFRNLVAGPVILGLVVLGASLLATQQLLTTIAAELTNRGIAEMDTALSAYLRPVEEIVDLSLKFGRDGRFHELPEKELDLVFGPLLEAVSQVDSVHVASASGDEYMLWLKEDGSYYNRISLVEEPGSINVREWSGGYTPAESLVPARVDSDYDARKRPWFQLALKSLSEEDAGERKDPLVWSDPYAFFTTKRPGITVSVAYRTPSDDIQILAFDIYLAAILDFARRIEVRESGNVYVMLRNPKEPDVLMLAIPPGEIDASEAEIEHKFPIPVSELRGAPRTFVDLVLSDETHKEGHPFRFEQDGERWWGATAIRPISDDRELWIAAKIPEDEILSGVPDITLITLVALLVTIVIMVYRARWLAQRYGEPIADLVAQTERIGRLNFSRETAIESPILEVQTLASSQDAMRRALDGLSEMNERSEIARELRRLPPKMHATQAGPWQVALWDEPAAQVGGCIPMVFSAFRKDTGEWGLAPDGIHSGAVMVLAATQLRDMAAAKQGPALRAMTRALLRLNMAAGALNKAILQELTQGGETIAPVSLVSAFLDGESNTIEILRDGQISILHWNAALATAQWWGASDYGTGQLDRRKVIELHPGDYVVIAADSPFDVVNRDRRRLRPSDLESWVAGFATGTAAVMADGLGSRVREFAAGTDLDIDVTLFVIGAA